MVKSIELIPGGRNKYVNEENKHEYIKAVCKMKMTLIIEEQIKSFIEGIEDIIPNSLLSILDPSELGLHLNGMPKIDSN
jgi:hypothetical protein